VAAEKIGLQAVLEDQQFQQGLSRYLQGLDSMEKGTQQMEKSIAAAGSDFDGLGEEIDDAGKSSLEFAAQIEIVEKAFEAFQTVANEGIELAKLGAQAERVEERFRAFSEAAGGAELIMQAFQEGAGGTVSEMDAMTSASRLLQMGLVTNADEMEKVVEIATRLGDQTISATQRTSDFAMMLANQSIPRLDNFGISSGAVRARIDELQKSMGMARDEAFKMAVFEEAAGSLGILGERVDDTAAQFEKAEAKMADARVEMGQKLMPVVGGLMGMVADLDVNTLGYAATLGTLLPLLLKFSGGLGGLATKLGASNLQMGLLGIGVIALGAALEYTSGELKGMNEEVDKAREVAKKQDQVVQEQIEAGEDLGDTMLEQAKKTNIATEAWNANIVTSTALGGVLGTHGKILDVYAQKEQALQSVILANTGSYAEYTSALFLYNDNVTDAEARIPLLTEAQWANTMGLGAATEALTLYSSTQSGMVTAALQAAEMLTSGASQTEVFGEVIRKTDDELKAINDDLGAVDEKMFAYIAAMEDGTIVTDDYEAAVLREAQTTRENIAAREEATKAQEDAAKAAEEAAAAEVKAAAEAEAALRSLAEAHLAARQAAFDQAEGLLQLAERLSDVDSAKTAHAAIADLQELWQDGKISQAEYKDQVTEVQDSFGLVTAEGRFLADGLDAIQLAIEDNRLPAENFAGALETLQERAEDGNLSQKDFLETIGAGPESVEKYNETIDLLTEGMGEYEEPVKKGTEFTRNLDEAMTDIKAPISDVDGAIESMTEKIGETEKPTGRMIEGTEDLDKVTEDLIPDLELMREEVEKLPKVFEDATLGMVGVGRAIVENMKKGFDAAWQAFLAHLREAASQIPAVFPGSEPEDPLSPLRRLDLRGEAIITNIAAGVDAAAPMLGIAGANAADDFLEGFGGRDISADEMENLMRLGGMLGTFGHTAAKQFGEEIDKIKDEMDAKEADALDLAALWGLDGRDLEAVLADAQKGIRDAFGGASVGTALLMQSLGRSTAEQDEAIRRWQILLQYERERTELGEEYAKQQEKILALQKAQSDLKFLQQQAELMDLIRVNGLDAAKVLGGLELGLDADMGAVLEAMTRALQQIIEKAEEELEIASPSKVFSRIGSQLMQGMAQGIDAAMSVPVDATIQAAGSVIAPMSVVDQWGAAMLRGGPGNSGVTVQAGGNTINNGMDEAQFDARVLRSVQRAMRGF